ncbi:MAG: hypothetical protein IJC84_03555 [Clostridia bacterium]|nr:hypothetical protein [Clostridia bacterium]
MQPIDPQARINKATLSCQSVIGPIDAAGSLTYGSAKHSNGRLFRILTESPCRIDKQYSVGAAKGTKKAAVPSGLLQPFFRNKKSQAPYLQIHVLYHD